MGIRRRKGEPGAVLPDNPRPVPALAWVRRNQGLEFDRAVFFTDAVFAIALTLLVVTIGRPELRGNVDSPSAMWAALSDYVPEIVAFFVAFILIARYWVAHHSAFSQLRAIDRGLIAINLVYLAFVAFLPVPSALVGTYEGNPVSVILFATTLACISGLEVLQFRHSYRHDLLRKDISPDIYRWIVIGSLAPVVMFVVTMPLAFISSTLCMTTWLIAWPLGVWLDRKAPPGVGAFLLGGSS